MIRGDSSVKENIFIDFAALSTFRHDLYSTASALINLDLQGS